VGPDRNGNLILVNGRVMTAEQRDWDATGVAIVNGKVAAVGADRDVLDWRRTAIDVVDLAGRALAPGLNDAHCHPLYLGFSLTAVDASTPPNRTIADILAVDPDGISEIQADLTIVDGHVVYERNGAQ